MRRDKKHTRTLSMIVRDERLSPHRRLLGELLFLWVDAETEEEKKMLFEVIRAQYGSPKKTLWGEDKDSQVKKLSEAEETATAALKDFFARAQEGILEDEVQEEDA
jgi:hypothetical protein